MLAMNEAESMRAVEAGSDRAGGALPSAHVPRAAASPRLSSFTSLRGAPHRPDPATESPLREQAPEGLGHGAAPAAK